jgi:hypothetical protein
MLQQDQKKNIKNISLHISAARRIKNLCILLQPFLPSDSWPWCSHGAARHMGQLRALICRQQLMQTGCLQFNARTPAAMARLRSFKTITSITVPSWTTTCAHTMNVHLMPQPLDFLVFHGSAFNPKAGLMFLLL